MIVNLPQTYLIGLCLLLFIIAILVGRQLYKVRKDEMKLIKLEKEDSNTKEDSAKMYELASVQLKKRLYPQATSTLKQALKKQELPLKSSHKMVFRFSLVQKPQILEY